MPKSKKKQKLVRNEVSNRLKETFKDFQEILGKSKFNRNIKKASKALAKEVKEIKTDAPKTAKKVSASKAKKSEPKMETA